MAPSPLTSTALLLAAAAGGAAASTTACDRAAALLAAQCTPDLGPWAGPARCCAPLAAMKALGCGCDDTAKLAVQRALPGLKAACGVPDAAAALAAACRTAPARASALADRSDSGPWEALASATRDLGARLAGSAAAWRDIMRGAAPRPSEGGGGSESETLSLSPDGSLAASLDIAYGAAPEAPGAVLAEIADWVASLGEVTEAGERPSADRAAVAADVAGLLDGVASRMDAALLAAGASPGTEVEYDVNIHLGTADGREPSTVDLDVKSADPSVSSSILADALAMAADGAAFDAAAAGVSMSAVVEEWVCPGGLAGWVCERSEALSQLASAGAFACAVAAVAALLGAFDDDDEDEDEDEDDDTDAEAARAEYAALAGGELTDARPPLWAVTAKH